MLDSATIVHCLPTASAKTFRVCRWSHVATKLDAMFHPLIELICDKRGRRIHRKVSGPNELLSNWIDIQRTKKNCFPLIKSLDIHITSGASVVSTGERSGQMATCNHEEAYTRSLYTFIYSIHR